MKTGMICEAVKSAFVHQMKEWESKDNCKDGGMKCLYKVGSVDIKYSSSNFVEIWMTKTLSLEEQELPFLCIARA
jgi:hypothetical protein